jgi:hypothetical protein
MIKIKHPCDPNFVMPTFRELRELANTNKDYFNEFRDIYREVNK